MGSKTYDGVWFISFSHDHVPPHVHGKYGGATVVVDLLADGSVQESKRKDAVSPKNAKRSDVRRILRVAREHAGNLHAVWEATHGKSA